MFRTLSTTDLGNQYVAVFTDSLTKWPEALAIKSACADVVAQIFVEEIVGTELLVQCCLIGERISFQSSYKKFLNFSP